MTAIETKSADSKKLRLDFTPSEWGMMMGIVWFYRDQASLDKQIQIDKLMSEVQFIESTRAESQ